MGLETVVNIADLVVTNPTSSDPKSQGDDHLRNIKTALKNDFAGFTGAILVTGVDGGAADVYTLTPANAVVAYTAKMLILFSPVATNLTTTPTINISGLGALTIKSVAGAAITASDLVINKYYLAEYDGTSVNLIAVTKNYVDMAVVAGTIPAQALGFYRSDGAVSAFTQTHTGYAQNEVKGADIASAATINLTTATGNFVHVTGTTTITAITIPSGADRTVVFDGILTLTYNATTLITPTAASITTAVGDSMVVRGDGAGNARVISYNRANGQPLAGGLTLLATLTPTASANIDFLTTFSANYDNYLIVANGITTASGSPTVRMQLAVAGVADSGSNYYENTTYSAATITAATTFVTVCPSTVSSGIGANFSVSIKNANSASLLKSVVAESQAQVNATPGYSSQMQMSNYAAANAVSGVHLFLSTGVNFGATGKVRVYGYSN